MCFSAPKAPKAPTPIALPPAPVSNVVAPSMTQAAPGSPKSALPENPLVKRRGKAGMIIQLGSQATNIPGM